jgi:hypothetical protein
MAEQGRRGLAEMKPSIASIVMAIMLAGTFCAHAQNTEEGAAAAKAGAARESGSQRVRIKRNADDDTYSAPGDVETSLPRLPSVFRNCEEPLPRYCQPYGSLFYWGRHYRAYHRHHHRY